MLEELEPYSYPLAKGTQAKQCCPVPNNNAATATSSWQTISPQDLFALINQGLLPFIQGLGQVTSANPSAGTVTTATGTYAVPGSVAVRSEQSEFEKMLPWLAVGGVVLLAVILVARK